MRLLEISLVLILAIRILAARRADRRSRTWLTLATVIILILHLALEGYRWQMLPLYAFALGFAIHALWARSHTPRPRGWPALIALLLALGVAILPPLLLPIPSTPPPDGPYPVGTLTLMLVDESRTELYGDDPTSPRAIMVQVWYPAAPAESAQPAPWLNHMEVMGPAISAELGMPSFFLDHVRYSRSHAYPEAPVAAGGPFPIILFSHGWNGFRAQNTFQMETLASHGYVLIAPDHTYGAAATVFPDGRAALNNPEALPYEQGLPADEFLARARTLGDQWAGDLSFILDTLQSPAPDSLLTLLNGHLDFEHIGALGHSTGGGAAIEFCARDPRCDAVFGMDPYMRPVSAAVLEGGTEKPVLALFSQVWWDDWENKERGFETFYAHLRGEKTLGHIQGTNHFDFSDLPAFSPLAATIGLKGPIPGKQMLAILRAYSLDFFNHTLKGQPASLLEASPPDYPEVVLEE